MDHTTLLQKDVDTWDRVVGKIREHWEELSVEEQDSFNMLERYWGKNTFDPGTCQKKIQILRSEADQQKNVDLQAYIQVFCELCVKIYTRGEDVLSEFVEIKSNIKGESTAKTPRKMISTQEALDRLQNDGLLNAKQVQRIKKHHNRYVQGYELKKSLYLFELLSLVGDFPVSAIKAFVLEGVEVNRKDNNGCTPLLRVVWQSCLETVKTISEMGRGGALYSEWHSKGGEFCGIQQRQLF